MDHLTTEESSAGTGALRFLRRLRFFLSKAALPPLPPSWVVGAATPSDASACAIQQGQGVGQATAPEEQLPLADFETGHCCWRTKPASARRHKQPINRISTDPRSKDISSLSNARTHTDTHEYAKIKAEMEDNGAQWKTMDFFQRPG